MVSSTLKIKLRPARWVSAVAPKLRMSAFRRCGIERMRSSAASSGMPICMEWPALIRLMGRSDSSLITTGLTAGKKVTRSSSWHTVASTSKRWLVEVKIFAGKLLLLLLVFNKVFKDFIIIIIIVIYHTVHGTLCKPSTITNHAHTHDRTQIDVHSFFIAHFGFCCLQAQH